jgi:hypothetical protein
MLKSRSYVAAKALPGLRPPTPRTPRHLRRFTHQNLALRSPEPRFARTFRRMRASLARYANRRGVSAKGEYPPRVRSPPGG